MTAEPYAFESDVVLARDGDHAAFTRLIQYAGNAVCAIALAISRNVHTSEDIAQEAFLAAWTNIRHLRNPASFLPWLRQLTRNQAHMWNRRHAREIADDTTLHAATDVRPSPDEALLADEEQRILNEVIDRIPDEAREVLVLYYREESSTRQVALLLGISEDAVRQRLARSRALVREEWIERFGRHLARTAPSAAFFAAVGASLIVTAPTASAAMIASSASVTTATAVKASVAGILLGWAGVFLGMRALEPPFDAREAHDLRSFRNIVLAVVTLGCMAVAVSASSFLAMLIALQSLYIILALMYGIGLRRILARRPQHVSLWSTAGRAATAAIAGTVLMGIVVLARR